MQLVSLDSVPRHPTLFSSIGILPWPKYAPVRAVAPSRCQNILCAWIGPILVNNSLSIDGNPSCLQTTCASAEPQRSSHTVPHTPLTQTSTQPSLEKEPPTSLTDPLKHA